RVAGVATHTLDNVRGNARLLLEGDPDKQFGLTGLQDGLVLQDVLDLVSAGSGVTIDPAQGFGDVLIAPEPILDACEALGRRLALAAEGGERVLIATGHPGGLDLLYRELERTLVAHGGFVIKPADGQSWREPGLEHDWSIGYLSGVGMQTDARVPRHTHWPDAMRRMLAEGRPDLVLAYHG